MFVLNQVKFTHSICLSVTAGVGLLEDNSTTEMTAEFVQFTHVFHEKEKPTHLIRIVSIYVLVLKFVCELRNTSCFKVRI